ncbi:hypothetical protein D3C75_711760 [compost metagenome]
MLAQIDQLVHVHPEEQVYVAGRYAQFAYELFEQKLFSLAINLTERAVQLDPDNEAIAEFHYKTESSKLLYKEYEIMSADPEISKWLQNFYLLFLFGDEVSEQDFEEYYQAAKSNLYEAARHEPEDILHSIRRLVIKYPLLFEQRKEWLQKFVEISKDSVQARNQYVLLQEDSYIIHSLKRLVALYLAEDVSKEEHSRYFDDILDEMSKEYAHSIVSSVNRLRSKYPYLFDLNPDLFEQLRSSAER